MTPEQIKMKARQARNLSHRMNYLPRQLETARRKVAALEAEAARLGMDFLLEGKDAA